MKPIRQIDIILIACGAAFSCITSVSASAQETGTFMRNPAESRTMSLAGAGVVSLDDVSVLDNAALSPFSPLFSWRLMSVLDERRIRGWNAILFNVSQIHFRQGGDFLSWHALSEDDSFRADR